MLTKSNYLIGLQCPKFLWITKNDKKRIPAYDEMTLARFKSGELLGVLATKVFEEGIDLSKLDFKENLNETKKAIKKRKPIFEPSFLVENLFSRADILIPVGKNEWDVIEVKSATKVKTINLQDVAFQKYVYEKSGLKIRNCFLMHLNNQYVKNGKIEPKELFIQTNITEKIEEFSKDLEKNIKKMFEIIEGEEPEFSIDDLATIEYENMCKEEFLKNLPENNIFQFNRISKKRGIELYKKGIVKIKDVPENEKLNDKQKIQKKVSEKKGEIHLNKEEIKNFINNLTYPIYYLDFETISPAIPKFDGMKPYQKIPFQFSLHVQEKQNGNLKHISFLADGTSDPRSKLLQSLKDNLGTKGSILVYHQRFEKNVLNECSISFPEFKEWNEKNILPRIKDLLDIFRDFSYYNPKQKGSASLKAVLPVLSDLRYDNLEIKKGDLASFEYERVTYGNVSENEKKKVRDALEKYCELDTLAEVEILKKLISLIK